MAKKGGSAPEAPNPKKTAAAEYQYNNTNVYTPSGTGSVYGHTDPTTGAFVAAPPKGNQQAAVFNVESPTQGAIRETLEPASVDFTRQFVSDNVENLTGPARVTERGDVAEDIFDRNFSLMAPAIDQSQERLLTNLQGRGIPIGSEAFNEAYGDQITRTQDTISRLAQDANIAAGAEQTRTFGLDQAERQGAMAEIAAVMGGSYQPPTNIMSNASSPINYGGMVQQQYQQELNAYNQQQQQQMSTASALGGLGAALIKSAAASKKIDGMLDPAWAGNVVSDVPVYAWSYKPGQGHDTDTHIGPLADHMYAATKLGRPDQINVIDYLGLLMAALKNALDRIELLERNERGEVFH
jgi:hypothetical protein